MGRVSADQLEKGFALGIPVFPHQNGIKMIVFFIEGYMDSKNNNKADFRGLSFSLML